MAFGWRDTSTATTLPVSPLTVISGKGRLGAGGHDRPVWSRPFPRSNTDRATSHAISPVLGWMRLPAAGPLSGVSPHTEAPFVGRRSKRWNGRCGTPRRCPPLSCEDVCRPLQSLYRSQDRLRLLSRSSDPGAPCRSPPRDGALPIRRARQDDDAHQHRSPHRIPQETPVLSPTFHGGTWSPNDLANGAASACRVAPTGCDEPEELMADEWLA